MPPTSAFANNTCKLNGASYAYGLGTAVTNRSKLLTITVKNIGCIGPDGLTVWLDDIVCLVGRNNTGKSTILRAYELVHGSDKFTEDADRCRWATEDQPSEVVLDVHIPEGIGNVHPDWKQEQDGLLIVRSRWQWFAPTYERVRTTWDPKTGEWAEEGKAGGADPVFAARLPQPLRVGSLDDAGETERLLLSLVLSPFVDQMKKEEANSDSELAKTVTKISDLVGSLAQTHEERFTSISERVKKGFTDIFPGLEVRLNVKISRPTFDLAALLKGGSGVRIAHGQVETGLAQQGTGTRRALFWSMLQVHNELKRELSRIDVAKKALEKELKKKTPDLEKVASLQKSLAADTANAEAVEAEPDDPAFPGYLLLVDEPENALHPLAARAAQKHLYGLAEDPDWQVILTTHSPYFVNPLADHTTIVRLERGVGEKSPVTPKTYRAGSINFDADTKRQLQAVQQMDTGFSEVFFGSFPILVEGDTEHAAFIASIIEENHELADQATVVRARGKAIIPALMRMLRHFKADFSLVHDADPPYRSDGAANGMWTINGEIRAEVELAREEGLVVRHRCSILDFERYLGGPSLDKDKPLAAYERVRTDEQARARVQLLLADLCHGEVHDPFPKEELEGVSYMDVLRAAVLAWAAGNGLADDVRFKGKPVEAV
jgi:putative ATP-dependent endonuclease of OLD family